MEHGLPAGIPGSRGEWPLIGAPRPERIYGRLSSAKNGGAAVQETACGLTGTVTARNLSAGPKLRRVRIPRAPPDGMIVRPGCAARAVRPATCDTGSGVVANGLPPRAELPRTAGQHGGTGRKGRTVAARVSIASIARPDAHSADGQGGRHMEAGCSMCKGCASSERCRGQKPHERRPGNLPSDTVGNVPGPAMRSVRCPIRTA